MKEKNYKLIYLKGKKKKKKKKFKRKERRSHKLENFKIYCKEMIRQNKLYLTKKIVVI